MAMATTEKSAEELQREIDELYRRKREITERLRDPRGLRKGMTFGANMRNAVPGGGRPLGFQRGVMRKPDDPMLEDQPPAKKRISSTVVKVNDEKPDKVDVETPEEQSANNAVEKRDGELPAQTAGQADIEEGEISGSRPGSRLPFLARRGDYRRGFKEPDHLVEPAPRVLTKEENPSLAKRNQRMFGALLGTLQRFAAEDMQLSSSDALMRRSDSLKRAELRAQEESERLRQQEREQLAEKRRRDLSLRARLAAKAEEKQLELLFIQWTEHHSRLSKFLRTGSEPHIYYMPAKPTEEIEKILENQQNDFLEWKNSRREELTKYQKDVTDWHLTNVEAEIDRWMNRRNTANHGQEASEREDDASRSESAHRRAKPNQEEDEEVDEDFMGDDDIDGNILGEDLKDHESEKEVKGVVEYLSGDDDANAR
eukprot:c20384_g1_i1 orf=273-1553(-)